jgi:Mor family transcriptional regulator
MKKMSALAGSFAIAAALSLQFGISVANAATHKIDCSKVMSDLQSGKKVAQVAKDMKISRSSVYRCRREAKAASGKQSSGPMASPGSMASPAAH